MPNYGSYSNEYLITNNFGSYSSANYLYGNTRKYHGLLVATQDQLLKYNVLNRVIDSYHHSNTEIPLTTNIYQNDIIAPQSFDFQKNFDLYPLPSWTFGFGGVEIIKTLLLLDENSLLIKYQFQSDEAGFFSLKPLINFRDIHSVGSNQLASEFTGEKVGNQIKIKLPKGHNLIIEHPESNYHTNQETYFNFYYPDEAKRGYLATENLFQPGYFEASLPPGKTDLYFKFSYNNSSAGELADVWQKNFELAELKSRTEAHGDALGAQRDIFEVREDASLGAQGVLHRAREGTQIVNAVMSGTREKTLVGTDKIATANTPDEDHLETFQKNLENQVELFINTANNHSGICAGYHWFDEWSRDTFIALPGLTFTKDKLDIAQSILGDWGKYLKNGLLPNRLLFTNMLNSLDGVFWFTIRLYQFSLLKNNFDLAEKFLPNLENVLIQFQQKTHNIEITKEGFLYDHNNQDALTWMDAKVDGKPVIDRSGMAVEIQALWYNYIRIMIILKEQLNDRTHLTYLKDLKVALEKNFEKTFWNYYQNCLFDCVRKDYTNKSIRPNQVIAVYLPFKLLGSRKNKMILATIEQKLLTDVGLRTLAREDPEFIKNYEGDQKDRDLSYHQGTIWPFLLGFYLCAYYDIYLKTKAAKIYVADKLLAFQQEITKQQLNYIPEIFSADDLSPQGCLAQAWSVAMLLETIYHLKNN